MLQNLWVFKSVQENERASQTIDSYHDSLTEYYNYDNFVANSQQVQKNDIAIIINKKEILALTKINNILVSNGTKTIRRCLFCSSTTIDKRKNKRPIYRCNRGHEFSNPIEEIKVVKKYKALYSKYISVKANFHDLKQLRPYYINGYNQNMSIQKLSYNALDLFAGIKENFLNAQVETLLPIEGLINEEYSQYLINENDERKKILKTIKVRRGQQKFRLKLLEMYNNTCLITGCKIVDILEAAHINPYKGEKDNHLSNGLLLRADIHTLFDLNLIAINPQNFEVEVSPKLLTSEYNVFHKIKLDNKASNFVSANALAMKWDQFQYTNNLYKNNNF